MKAHGGGSIINICSGAAINGLPGYSAYAATKEGIRGLSRVATNEWGADNIRINVINPSAVTETLNELTKDQPEFGDSLKAYMANGSAMKRVGDPYADIAPVMMFFASDDSRFVTGQTISVDGGGIVIP